MNARPRIRPWQLFVFFPLFVGATAAGSPRFTPADATRNWDDAMANSAQALKSNRLLEAVTRCEQAITIARALGPHDAHLSRSLVLRAEIYMWEKQNDRAEQTFQAAIADATEATGPNDPSLVHPLSSLANFYYYVTAQRAKVPPLFERILRIIEQSPRRDDRDVVMWSRNLALVYQELGDFSRAEPLMTRALTLAKTADPGGFSGELVSGAQFYRAWKKYDQAEKLARRALELREKALAAAPSDVDAKLDVAVAWDELGAIYLAERRLDSAEDACRRSLAIVETFMTPDQPDLRPRLAALAAVLQARGKFAEAAPIYRRLATVTEHNLGGNSPELAGVLADYASVLRELRQPDEARALESRAAAIRKVAPAPL